MPSNQILASMAVKIEANTASFNKGLAQTNAQLSSFQNAVTSAGRVVAGYFGTQQILSGIVSGIQTMAQFEAQMSAVQAISGATGQQMQALTDDALKLGAATQFAASKVAGLQLEYSRLGFSVPEILNATKATIDLATATGEDLSKSTFILGSSIRAFNLPAKEAGHLADVMAGAFNKTALQLDDFGEAMKYVGPVAAAANISFEEASAVLGVLADNNIRGTQAGTAFRRIIVDLAKDGRPLVDRLRELSERGITVQNTFDDIGRIGQTALLVLEKGVDRIKPLTTELTNMVGEASRVSDIMRDNLSGDFTKLQGTIESAVSAGSKFNFVLRGIVQEATNITAALTQDKLSVLEKFAALSLAIATGGGSLIAAGAADKSRNADEASNVKRAREAVEANVKGYEDQSAAAQKFIDKQQDIIDKAREDNAQTQELFRKDEAIAIESQAIFDGKLKAFRLLKQVALEYVRVQAESKPVITEKVLRDVPFLTAEIKKLQELQSGPGVTSNSMWEQYAKQIAHLSLELTNITTKDLPAWKKAILDVEASTVKAATSLSKPGSTFQLPKLTGEAYLGVLKLDSALKTVKTSFTGVNNALVLFEVDGLGKLQKILINVGQLLIDLKVNAIAGFAEALGSALAGGKDIGKTFLQGLVSFLGQFGRLLIAAGVAKLALDKLLTTPAGAVAAIGAGIALVALTSAINTKFSQQASKNSSSGSTRTVETAGGGSLQLQVSGQFVARGQDLYVVLNNYTNNKNG